MLPTSSPSVRVDHNRINIPMSFLWTNSEIGQQRRVMPLSAFWDPDFAYHGSLPLPELEPEFRTLLLLFSSELPDAEPLPLEPNILPDPNPFSEIESLPPMPRHAFHHLISFLAVAVGPTHPPLSLPYASHSGLNPPYH